MKRLIKKSMFQQEMKVEDLDMESSPGNNKTNKKKFDKIG